MSNLYQEAIADAKRLRQLAEENAKNKILEEIAPRIKRLIEAELSDDPNSELEDELGVDSEDAFDADLPDLDDEGPSDVADDLAIPDLSDLGLSTDDDELDIEDDEPIEVSSGSEKSIEAGDDERVTVNITVEGERRRKARELFENLSGPKTSYQMAKKRFVSLRSRLNETKNPKKRAKILLEMRKLQKTIIFNNNDTSSLNLAKAINKILKENKMSRRTRRSRRLNENAWWLREADDDAELADDEFGDLGDDELEGEEEEAGEEAGGEEVTISADDARDAAASFLDDLGFDAEEVLAGEAGEGEDFDLEDDEEGDDLEDEEEGDADEMYEADEQDEQDEEDEVVEISEAMIRRELKRLSNKRSRRRPVRESRRRRPASRRRRMFESEAKEVADQFGGGSLDKEHFVEVDEDTLLNALAEELGSDANASSGGDASKVADNFGGGSAQAEAIKEARRQRRRAQQAAKAARMNEAKAKKLKKELNESNLFNAKLLYVNKLMQQHDLNAKQQRAIVEAIDNAKTLREAKLLYTSLTESLRKRAANKASLNESAVRTGSASKSLRSSAPAKSGESLDRWAVLAGIKK